MTDEQDKRYPFALAIRRAIEQICEHPGSSTLHNIRQSLDECECEVSDAEFGRIIYDGIRAAIERREAEINRTLQ